MAEYFIAIMAVVLRLKPFVVLVVWLYHFANFMNMNSLWNATTQINEELCSYAICLLGNMNEEKKVVIFFKQEIGITRNTNGFKMAMVHNSTSGRREKKRKCIEFK